MAKSKKIRKYLDLKKQAERAAKTLQTLRVKEQEAFDKLSGTECREITRMIREAHENGNAHL
jgi:hypothetical protein